MPVVSPTRWILIDESVAWRVGAQIRFQCLLMATKPDVTIALLNVPVEGEQQTSELRELRSAFDPGCVKTWASRECAELFTALVPPRPWLPVLFFSPIQRNRDKISTCKFDARSFHTPWT